MKTLALIGLLLVGCGGTAMTETDGGEACRPTEWGVTCAGLCDGGTPCVCAPVITDPGNCGEAPCTCADGGSK